MNKKLSMAVAGAVIAFGASAANAGIIIPAGDWTVDLGGNLNAYYTNTSSTGKAFAGAQTSNNIGTGLLPSAIGIGAKTRQNDLDIAVQFTFFTGTSSGPVAGTSGAASGGAGNNTLNIRQAYLTFGDASWGTIKAGRDLGIYGSDAILSDMTLLGVGTGGGGSGSSTLGRIGSGYIYADWVGQISYASPKWNGFGFNVGLRQPFTNDTAATTNAGQNLGYEGKVTYDWAGDYAGKVWASAISQDFKTSVAGQRAYTAVGYDVGAKVTVADFGLVGYYYGGDGLAGPSNVLNGVPFIGNVDRNNRGGYVQATYTIPGPATKLGVSWGTSQSDKELAADTADFKSESWIIGAYHPLTKSLNLVAEYTNNKLTGVTNTAGNDGKQRTLALGAILFF